LYLIAFLDFAPKSRNEQALALFQELSGILILGTFIKISPYVSISVKIGQNYEQFARIHEDLSGRIYIPKVVIFTRAQNFTKQSFTKI